MNKQELIYTAKIVIKDQYEKQEFCSSYICKSCPASWNNNVDHLSCHTSGRYKIEWLQNWLKDNDTTETTDIVISRELLDEVIDYIKHKESISPVVYFDKNLFDKLVKLRGEKVE